MWQGFGLNETLCIEAFPNSDAYKLGTEIPYLTFAHLFIRQNIGWGGEQEPCPTTCSRLRANRTFHG
jgi:high affinity Mn2+ porin